MALLDTRRTLQLAETQFLQAAGFAIKNTFIDEASAGTPDEQPSLLRRAATLPLPKHEVLLDREDDEDACVTGRVGMVEGAVDGAESDLSTHASATDSDSDAASEGDAKADEEEEEERVLSDLIRQQCSFLRIYSTTLSPMDQAQSKKLQVKGVSHCLRVCVQGLPAQKRMKWQNPLAWTVALSLQRAGVEAFAKRSKLYVPLNEGEEGEVVLIDLCAPRIYELAQV